MAEVLMRGVDELVAKLENLKYQTKYKGGRFALRKAAQLVRNAARQGAQSFDDSNTGRKISDNIVERWNSKLYKATGDLSFRVGVMQGAVLPKPRQPPNQGGGGPTPHWRLKEFGTEKMPAQPFMRPALANNLDSATDEFIRQYSKTIDRAIKKGKA